MNPADPKKYPTVVEFIDADTALREFKDEHRAVFEQYGLLVERRNAALQQAEQAVRSDRVSVGPFLLKHFRKTVDAAKLYEQIGAEAFLALGGTITTKEVYEIDVATVDKAIAQKKIAEDVGKEVRVDSPTYHNPKPVVV